MAEGLPQLDRSPGAIRRNLPPPEGARAASVQSREASSMSPLRDLSPLHSSAPSPGSTDGIHTPASLELVDLKDTAENVEELLKSQLVILSGGRDKEGQSILTVPAKPKDFHFSKGDLLRVTQYLTSLPRDEIRECGYSLIIDGRSATWSTIKSLLHMFQECLPGQIHVAYIISPSHFLEKKRASMKMGKEKERLEFTTTVVPVIDRLGHYLDMNQVTTELGGLLPYNHKEWMKMRMDVEHFIAAYNALLQRFAVFERELCLDVLAEDAEGAEKMIAHHASLLQEIRGAPKNTQKEGTDILVVIEQNQDNFGQSCMTPEKINTMAVVRSLLERVNKRAQMLEDLWRSRKHHLDQTLQLRVFENAIGKINGWLKVKSPEILGGKQEIGDSVQSSEEVLWAFQRTEAKSKGVQDNMTKLRMMADRMCGANHFASEDLNHHIAKLNSRWVRHNELMGLRKRILEGATNFHKLQHKFVEVCDGLSKQLQSPLPRISGPEDVTQLLSRLDEMQSAAGQVMEEVSTGAQSLAGQMQRAVSITQGSQLAPDYSKGLYHVGAVQTELKERWTTVGHLIEARRTALGQCRQVFKCEQDVVKVIAWLQHLANQMISTQGDLGESQEAVQHLQLDHGKFVETAKKTFLGGQDLLSTALKNREKYSLDPLPNQDLQRELSEKWESIDSAIKEREKRLEMAESFHRDTEEILRELERLSHPTANLPETRVAVEGAVEELGHHGNDLRKKMEDAIALGESLLLTMAQPLFSGQSAKETNEQALLCAELIRGRIDHLKTVSLDFHRILQVRRKCLKDAILLRSVEEEVGVMQAWCKGEGQLQVGVVLSKGMAMSDLKKVEQEHSRTVENKWKVVEQLKNTAESLSDCNHFSPQIVAMATELLAVWSEYLSESSTLSDLCRNYVTFWESCKQLDGLMTQFSTHSGEADLRWEDTTHELLKELQQTEDQLSQQAQQVMTEGHKVVEKLGKVPGCNALIDDVEGQTLEIQRRMDQMHAYWLKVESTMSNTLQLRKYKEEACSLLIEMNDMVGKLGRVDFGSSCDDFEVKEQKFGATAEQCSARLHRCDEVKSLIQRLVLLGVAGDSEGTCEKIVVEMGSLRSTLQTSLDVVRRGFEGADDVTRKCAKLCQKIALLDQLSPTVSKADYIQDLTTCREDVVTTYRNWLQLVKPFAIGSKLSGEVEEACQLASEVISDYHRQVDEMRKVRQVEQEADKHIDWLDSRVRQFLVANAEFGENGEMARELQSKLSNFLDSVQPSLKGIAHLISLCQSLTDSGSTLVGLMRPYHSRLRACQGVCEKALKERLDICTAFVDFEDTADEELRCIQQIEGYCEEIPVVMEDPHRGGDILQSGNAAINEMTALIAVLEKKVSVFAHLAFSDMSVEMGPPLQVDGALSRLTQELNVLRKKVESVIQRWKQGEAELQSLMEYSEFWSSHKEMTSWLQLHGLPYLSTDLGSRLSEAEDLILEQQEFQSKVKKIEREVEAAVALGNSATARNPVPEVAMATSDLISYFSWFKQLVEVRGMALARAVEFFKEAKEVSRSLATLTAESEDSERERLAREISRIRAMAEDIVSTVTQLQMEECPVIGENLLHVVDSLEDQLSGSDTHGALCLESPPAVTPQHTLSLSPLGKPNLPKRRDSKRKYLRYSASVKRSSTASQEGVEDIDAGKKAHRLSVAMVTKELCESEEEYVYCLSLLVDHYLEELAHSPHRPDFIVERKTEVFGNTEEVYAVHKKLLGLLRKAKGTEQICRCFLQLELDFRVYINYLKIISSGWKTLTVFGGTFFDDVKRSRRLGYPMIECYNRTFQRLEQYCRMFKELLVATQKEDLHSVRVVQQAVAVVTQTHKLCTNLVAFGNLRGSPTPLPEEGLLLVDDFIVLTIKNKRKRPQQLLTVFLHEDCLILTKEELKDPIHPPIYHFQDQLLCSELSLTENYKTKDSKLKFAISSGPIAAAETVHVLQPAFKEGAEVLKDKWTRSISDLLMRQLETTKALKGRSKQENLPPPIVHHVDIRKDKRKGKGARESKTVSKVIEDKRASEHVTIEKITPTDMKASIKAPAESDIYVVYKKYRPIANEELPLSVGQLVEVLDRSGEMWLVCTVGEDSEPMEGFVPAKALRKHETDETGRPVSMVSQYSFVSQMSADRTSVYSQMTLPGPLPDTLSQSSGSRPTSMVAVEKRSPRATPEDLTRPVSLPPAPSGISSPLHQPSVVAEDITWYCVEEYRDDDAGFVLHVGEAVEVFDTSGPQWYVSTSEDPREGFLPPDVLSQVPPAQLLRNQPSVAEDRTPTLSQPPLGGQVSVVEAQTPTTQPQRAEMAATLTQGNLQEAVITALVEKQQQRPISTPTEYVKTPTECVKTPTEPVKTPTESAKSPTELVKIPTEPTKTPTEPANTPTELANTPTESTMTPTEPKMPTAEVMLTADDTPPSYHAPPPVDQPRPPVSGSFLNELTVKLERKNTDTHPAVTMVIPPPRLPPSTHSSLESEKSGALYTALASFEGSPEENTVSLHEGQVVHVIDRSQNEWWLVVPLTHTGEETKEGWVPADFLQALEDPPPSDHDSSLGTPAAGGDQTPVDIGDQTPGLLVTSDPFDTVVAEIQQPVTSQPEVTEVKSRLYTSIAHVMAVHPNELSLQLAETVEVVDDSRSDWWLVRTLPAASVPSTEGWVPTAALTPVVQEEVEPPKEDAFPVGDSSARVVLANFAATEDSQLSIWENQVVRVMDDSRDDWTLVLADNGEGWVPKSYLRVQGAHGSEADDADESSAEPTDDFGAATKIDGLSPVQDLLEFTISELLKSEKEYVARLNFAMLHYLPLIFESMAPRALRAQKETLLGNLNDIWEFHSKHFLPVLVDAGGDPSKIGQAFLDHRDSFERYVTFCSNKTKSEAVYSEFRQHMMDAMHALGQRLELSNYLILPIQRLTKYGLLLGDILKYVNRLDCKSLPLERAVVMLQDTSTRANNSIHYFELEGLAKKDLPLCDLDLQELFWVKCDGIWKERRVFLFKLALVLTKPLAHEGMGQSLVIQKVVDLTSVSMAEDDLEESDTSLVFFDLKTGSKVILQAPAAEVRTTWVKKMSDLVEASKHTTKTTALVRAASDSSPVSFKRVSSFSVRRSWLSRTRSERKRRLTDGGSPLVVRKKTAELPTVGSHLLVLECIVVEDTDDVTLEAGDTVKLIRILSPDKYLVQTVGESGTTVEGTVSAEFLRAIGEEKKLEVAPEIQLFPGNTVVRLGRAAILSCCFAAYPAPSVVWMKDNQVIHPTQKVKTHTSPTSSVLEILEAEFSDKGEYICVVTNSAGSTQASGYLLVQGPPGAPGQPSAVKVTSTTAKLKWTSPLFDGGDDVMYQVEQQYLGSPAWQPIVQLAKPAFLVRDLEPATVYAFRVIAFHSHGYSPPSQVSEPVKTKSLVKSVSTARSDLAVSPDILSSPLSQTPPCEPLPPLPCFIKTGPVPENYSILSRIIGVGQFAVVQQAFNQQTNQKCAAKQVTNKLLGCSEAKLLQQLDHPHIVKFFDAFELVDGVTLMMELVSEGELLEYIVSKDNLTEAVCVRYLTQLLRALDYLSQKNIVHLDIKPENLHLSRSPNDSLALKLIDFGSAHEAPLPEAPREYISPEFLPPEVLGGESPSSSPVSDMWSVGVVTYVMLSGMSPFFAPTPESTVCRILDARYSFSNDAFGQVSEDAKSFIASLLQLSPRHRSTASKALQHIWITTLGTSNEGWPMAKLDTTLLKRFMSRRKWLCKAVAVGGVCLEEGSANSSPSIEALQNEHCEPPLLWDGPHDITSASGSKVTLRCRFSGVPTPSIYWYHEGAVIDPGDRVSLSAEDGFASLLIPCLEPSMAGEYMCTAVNNVGTATTQAVITVQDVPGSPAEIKVVPLGSMSALLSWIPPKSHGNSDLQHYIVEQSPARQECWTELTRGTSTTALVVDNLSGDKTYNFRVSAVNRVGQGPFSKPIALERSYI